jgi:uncharacterized membrane protein (DUF106 family)
MRGLFLFLRKLCKVYNEEVIDMLSNLREQMEALTKKNTELIATGVFSMGGIIAVTIFAWILSLLDNSNTTKEKES